MTADVAFWLSARAAVLGCLLGSIVWHLDEAPGGTAGRVA